MKAFVGHSFEEKNSRIVNKIIEFLESTGITCQTGEKAQNKSIAEKVKERILDSDIFVGIFTCDEEFTVKKGFLGFFKNQKVYTTSNWVIQESGFAIGSKKELIFLVEKEIPKFPELQGDMEVIYFNRDSLEETFLKLNQMVESIRRKNIKGMPSKTQDRVEDLEKQEIEKQKEEVKEEIDKRKQEAFNKLSNAIFKEKDPIKVKEIYEKELKTILSDDENPIWKAIILKYSHELGDTKAFDQLVKHAEENKNNPEVIWQLAMRYRDMREYHIANEKFLFIANLYDINKEGGKGKIINCYEQASLCLAFDGKYDDAIRLLHELLHKDVFKEFKAKILSGLAKISKISKDSEKFFIYAEGSLNIDSSDTELRFDLAYQYSQNDQNKLALLHYKKLTDTIKSPGGLNNLGVQYQTIRLPAKSIKSFFKAAEHNLTLAMANIAQRYLNEGFIEDAKSVIKKANELSKEGVEVHGNIGLAKNRLDKILEDEENKEKEILLEAEKEREFRVKYSEAFYSNINVVKEKFEGIWETPWGDLKLLFDKSTNSFKVDEKKKIEPEEKYLKIRLIKIEGNVEKMSGRYKIEIEEIIEYQVIPPGKKIIYEASGYMVINEDCSIIDVMEKAKEDTLKIHSWRKKTA